MLMLSQAPKSTNPSVGWDSNELGLNRPMNDNTTINILIRLSVCDGMDWIGLDWIGLDWIGLD